MVQTRRELERDKAKETHRCSFCERLASYWSQFERADGELQGRVVWHCQFHRDDGRQLAMDLRG